MSFNEFGFTRASVAYHPFTGRLIPTDTPVYMPFTEGEMGVLMVEGVTNLLTENQSSYDRDTSGWSGNLTYLTRINTVAWHGSWSLKCTPKGEGGARGVYSTAIPVTAGESYTAQCRAMQLSGGTVKLRLLFEWWGAPTASTSYGESVTLDDTWQEIKIENKVAPEGATRVIICIYTENRVSASEEWVIDGIQLIQSSYPLPWHIGGSTRANPLKWITLPEPLPATFGIGIAAKMLHAHDAADRTFWQAGDYRCYFDSTDNKIKLTNGVVEAETAAVNWSENDYVGIYAGRENGNLFIQTKIAGAVTERAEMAGDAIDSGTNLYVGSKADGSESVNAVVADFVLHDRPEDIDPIGYLSQIGKPKVTAVVGEGVESIPGSQLRDGLFREIPRVFSKPAAVSIAPGVFYQEVDLGNWAAGLRVYASEDMVMFIAGREIEIPKSVLLYLPWKVRTFEVRQKSAAAVGTLYIYGGC